MKVKTLGPVALAFFCVLIFGCSSSIKSVVDHSNIAHPYHAPLAVLPCKSGPLLRLSEKIGNALTKLLTTDSNKMDLLILERREQELTLNSKDDVNQKITDAVKSNQNDVVLVFKPTHLDMYNGAFVGVKYLVTAIDVSTDKEVWKAEINWSGGSLAGVGAIAESVSKTLYGRLVGDGVL